MYFDFEKTPTSNVLIKKYKVVLITSNLFPVRTEKIVDLKIPQFIEQSSLDLQYLMNIIFLVCFLFLPKKSTEQHNLIKNSNFSSPPLIPNGYYSNFAKDWYGTNFNLLNRNHLGTLQGQYLDLKQNPSLTSHANQDINLSVDGLYELTFLLKNGDNLQYCQAAQVFWNNQLLQTIKLNPSKLKIFSYFVRGNVGLNVVRFSEVGNCSCLGYFLDDVSLIGTYKIYNFTCKVNLNGKRQINVICDFVQAEQPIFGLLVQNFIFRDNQSNISHNIVWSLNFKVKMELISNSSQINIDALEISFPDNFLRSMYIYNVFFDIGVNKFVEKMKIHQIYAISEVVVSWSSKVYSISKACVLSYFLFSVISFWNLSLMYNTLNIRTVPVYVRQFLEGLTSIFFNLGSIQEWTGLNFGQYQVYDKQQAPQTKFQYLWYGSFGISSKFFQNNLESLIIFCLSILKIGALYILKNTKCLANCFRKRLPLKKTLEKVILLEAMSIQTFMVLSATIYVFNTGLVFFSQKLNSIAQVTVIFQSFTILYIYVITTITALEKRSVKSNSEVNIKKIILIECRCKVNSKLQKKSLQSLTQEQICKVFYLFSKKNIINSIFQFLQTILLPFFILFQNPVMFLSVTTSFFTIRAVWFYKNMQLLRLTIVQKTFTTINILVFVTLSYAYLIF